MPSRKGSNRSGRRLSASDDNERAQISNKARRSALIQLKFGRASHFLSTFAAVLLALAAIVAYLISEDASLTWLENSKWLIPLIAGAFMSITVVYLKWEPFLTDRTANHFIVSYIAMAVPLILIILVVLYELNYVEVGTGGWIYPLSFVGISFSLVSIAMIWEGMSRRKVIAIVSAFVPFAIMTAPAFYDAGLFGILPLVYLGSAVCIQLSGSMMHVMSTSTSVQEREILKASDAKMLALRAELERREEEIAYKERALVEKELGFDQYEKALGELREEIDQRKKELENLEAKIGQRMELLKSEAEKTSGLSADLKKREEILQQRELELNSREREIETITEALGKKESQLQDLFLRFQEDQARIRAAEKQLKDKSELIEEQLRTLKAGRESFMGEQKALAEKEKELQLRESAIEMRLRSLESATAAPKEEISRLRRWEEKLHEKEKKVAALEAELTERRLLAEQLMSDAKMQLASAEERLKAAEEKEKKLFEKESVIERLEKEIANAREDLAQKIMELDTLRQEAEQKKSQYSALIERVSKREIDLAKKDEDLKSQYSMMESRENSLRESIERLAKERQDIENRRKELLELEKEIGTKVSQQHLKELELRERQRMLESGIASMVSSSSDFAGKIEELQERERALEHRERLLSEREREARRRAFTPRTLEIEAEVSPVSPKKAEATKKFSTGTKRLDDLLYGGIPPGSSVLFIGPPFSGKETGILSFLAEGLRSGIPAIIVTTSKSPSDLSRDFAPIMPDLLELERIGLVRWLDATSAESADAKSSDKFRKNYVKVDGPDDLAGIIEGLDKLTSDIRNGAFRGFKLGYLSLSTSISHVGDMEATKFVQGMARTIRDLNSVGMFALEKGMHSEQQIESIQHLMDGSFLIKVDKQKYYLSVVGIGEVQSRDWIEFKLTNSALVIGAFSLERIR
ncbi:MAG: ATPase domain-containing protein [Thermoplasmata archaeon]